MSKPYRVCAGIGDDGDTEFNIVGDGKIDPIATCADQHDANVIASLLNANQTPKT